MKKVLLTGATGALGAAVTSWLQEQGDYQITATSRHNPESDSRLDVCDFSALEKKVITTKPDLIIHLAATFDHDFDHAYSVNVASSRVLLETVKQQQLSSRVILIGSAAEYGVIRPEENPVKENHVLNPVSVYGMTKAWQTQLASLFAANGVDVVVARVFNLYGDNLSERLFIGRLQKQIDAVVAGKQTSIELGSLQASRDYLSTQDAARQLGLVIEHGVSGEVYHIASGQPVTMREMLLRYLKKNKLDSSLVREAHENTNRKGYDVPVIYADVSKLKHLLDENVRPDEV